MERVLITGGAGFIGSHLADLLLSRDTKVLLYDNLVPQVHGAGQAWPEYLDLDHENLDHWFGDVRDIRALMSAFFAFRPDTVIHLAARVGVGQSNYQIADYTSANVTGTAVLMDCIIQWNKMPETRAKGLEEVAFSEAAGPDESMTHEEHAKSLANIRAELSGLPETGIRQVFLAGSMSSYGEGAYRSNYYLERKRVQDKSDPTCRPVGIHESDALMPASVYAMNKRDQEQLALMVGELHGLDVRVGRFFNVMGSRQALSNPYTGVAAIFASRVLAGKPPRIYEDGEQSRDFIHVSDLCAGIAAIMDEGPPGQVYNIGRGEQTTVNQIAKMICDHLHFPEEPEITGLYRAGDIRHCFADASKLKALGWEPSVSVEDAIGEVCDWVKLQAEESPGAGYGTEDAHDELKSKGLLK